MMNIFREQINRHTNGTICIWLHVSPPSDAEAIVKRREFYGHVALNKLLNKIVKNIDSPQILFATLYFRSIINKSDLCKTM
mmetsp:Transcript_13400/g.17985  ORF Transcript_13400/g.17985 Transcript_13400/m.17985 type:complete len:81 (+) Transcript_13400:51-293(+)